MYEVTTDK